MRSRALIWVVVAIALAAGVGGVLYAFGTPVGPVLTTPQSPNSAAVTPPDPAAAGEAPAPDPDSPLAIEIPGCVCHSDDPELVAEHSEYRMNQCAGCHVGEVPTGQ